MHSDSWPDALLSQTIPTNMVHIYNVRAHNTHTLCSHLCNTPLCQLKCSVCFSKCDEAVHICCPQCTAYCSPGSYIPEECNGNTNTDVSKCKLVCPSFVYVCVLTDMVVFCSAHSCRPTFFNLSAFYHFAFESNEVLQWHHRGNIMRAQIMKKALAWSY